MPKKTDWEGVKKNLENLYVFTGRKSDLTTLFSMAVINPMLMYVFIGYVAGRLVSLPLVFLIMDSVLFLRWVTLIKKRKKSLEKEMEAEKDRMDRIKKKISELEDME